MGRADSNYRPVLRHNLKHASNASPSYVIVAIPSADDYVWKISSEKVPHLTLLFLGDNLPNPERVVDYLDHAVETSLTRFGLDVERRGTLGPEDADVLFFGKYGLNIIKQFRGYLLANQDINVAYNSAEQYPEWVPHLTLGYPTSPAKKDDRDYPGISWVNFDRIAIWTGDYEGPEFELKSESADLSMSDFSTPEDALSHYGVKGMHWGVHRVSSVAGAISKNPATKAIKDNAGKVGKINAGKSETKKQFNEKVATAGGLHKISDKDLKAMLNRLDMERKYSNIVNEDAKQRAEGRKAVGKILLEVGKIAVPLIVGGLGAKAAADHGVFRTSATVGRPTISVIRKALGS